MWDCYEGLVISGLPGGGLDGLGGDLGDGGVVVVVG